MCLPFILPHSLGCVCMYVCTWLTVQILFYLSFLAHCYHCCHLPGVREMEWGGNAGHSDTFECALFDKTVACLVVTKGT